PSMQIVEVADGHGDAMVSRDETIRMMKEHPELAGIFVTEATGGAGAGEAVQTLGDRHPLQIISFDTNKTTLDMIKNGTISATIAQGTWNM
ncbi:substrate-binding domain-containing protein, partial [Bacillus subtilis]|uniref:substrate-binding domain-containing protein n=2 Tax=Bacillales TaxID=1385 RepID=UPI003396E878